MTRHVDVSHQIDAASALPGSDTATRSEIGLGRPYGLWSWLQIELVTVWLMIEVAESSKAPCCIRGAITSGRRKGSTRPRMLLVMDWPSQVPMGADVLRAGLHGTAGRRERTRGFSPLLSSSTIAICAYTSAMLASKHDNPVHAGRRKREPAANEPIKNSRD